MPSPFRLGGNRGITGEAFEVGLQLATQLTRHAGAAVSCFGNLSSSPLAHDYDTTAQAKDRPVPTVDAAPMG